MKKGIYKRNSKNTNTFIAIFATIAAVSMVGTAIFASSTSALTYQEAVDVQFTFAPTVSVNLSGNLTIYDLSPGNSADSNIITVRASSNEANGYTLYSTVGSSSSNYTDLRLSSSNTSNVFTNLSSNKATLSAFSDNTWGYSYCNTTNDCDNSTTYWVSGNAGSTNAGYNGLPIFNANNNTTGVILADSNSANETVLKFKIGAKASSSQLAGAYTNIVNFINVAKVVTTSYTVNYNDTSSEATGMPTQQTGTTTNSTVTLRTTAPTRSGYMFKGWCDVSTNDDTCSGTVTMPGHVYALNTTASSTTVNLYAMWSKTTPAPIICSAANKICYSPNTTENDVIGTMGEQSANASTETMLLASNFSRAGYGFAGWNTEPDYSGALYGPQETITTPSDMSSGLPLYAVWVKSEGSLQDTSKVSSVCSRLTQSGPNVTRTLNSVSALTDQRDNETYAIAKLADGNCWMIENLRLDNTNTDNSTGALAQGYGTSTTYGNFSGLATSESANFSDSTTVNSIYYSGTQSGTASINIGTTNYPGYRMPRYNNRNTSSRASNPTSKIAAMYSYGNYYTWSAALANTISYDGLTATDADGKTSETVGTSLCPKGWKLPYGYNAYHGNTSGGFYYLDSQLGGTTNNPALSTTWRSYPNNFLYSGEIYGSSFDRGYNGYYWSSSNKSYHQSFTFELSDEAVYPGDDQESKYSGLTIRCLLAGS